MIEKRNYQIYLIDEQIVDYYISRERMFFDLFNDYAHSRGEYARILGKQIDYITKNIPVKELKQTFEEQLYYNKSIYNMNGLYYVLTKGKNLKMKSSAQLEIHNRVLQISSEGSYDAETIFFECLRKCENCFLAIDLEHERYGWLKPIKQRNFI
ncbi:sporulation inhibitor of replication protein SirA [Bacillus massiliigorillae]|uniref:sporulation inhibitor of replication protein SirA n=1 Tax=Bacillus massiliigorillae TaxID=1243664 RepID=UPI0005AA7354|nr:sporulation inhibitor of replication protein SirA [Bacillus massiliigorillae]